MTIGKKLYQVRRSLGLTQKQMAAKVLSQTQYRRIETGLSDIKARVLVKLCAEHQLSIVDFLAEFAYQGPSNVDLHDQIMLAFLNQNCQKLKKINSRSDLENNQTHELINWLLLKLEGNNKQVLKELQRNLQRRIWQDEKWDDNTLWFFLHIMDLYDFSELTGIVQRIFNQLSLSEIKSNRTLHLLANIAISYADICYSHKNSYELETTICYLRQLPNAVEFALYKIISNYYVALLHKHNKQAKQILDLLKSCGYANYVLPVSDFVKDN